MRLVDQLRQKFVKFGTLGTARPRHAGTNTNFHIICALPLLFFLFPYFLLTPFTMAPKPTDIPTFADHQLKLLDTELKTELAETAALTSNASPKALQRAGLAILNLTVTSQRTGLGGKTVIELELDPAVGGAEAGLPEHGIRTGDIVGVQEAASGAAKKSEKAEKKEKGVNGVVTKVGSGGVSVALDKEEADVPTGRLWMYVAACRYGTWQRLIVYIELSSQMMLHTRGILLPAIVTAMLRCEALTLMACQDERHDAIPSKIARFFAYNSHARLVWPSLSFFAIA